MRPTLDHILAGVSHATGVPVADITGKNRSDAIAFARSAYAAIAHRVGFSYPEIAEHMGRASHTGILKGAKQFERRLTVQAKRPSVFWV